MYSIWSISIAHKLVDIFIHRGVWYPSWDCCWRKASSTWRSVSRYDLLYPPRVPIPTATLGIRMAASPRQQVTDRASIWTLRPLQWCSMTLLHLPLRRTLRTTTLWGLRCRNLTVRPLLSDCILQFNSFDGKLAEGFPVSGNRDWRFRKFWL